MSDPELNRLLAEEDEAAQQATPEQAAADRQRVEENLALYERLHATTDVTVWAKEWVATAAQIIASKGNDPLALLDEGWMIGWFANYAQACNDALRQRKPHPGTWNAFLHFWNLDQANAAIHVGTVRYSPITFRLAEFIHSEYPMHRDVRLDHVLSDKGAYAEDTGR